MLAGGLAVTVFTMVCCAAALAAAPSATATFGYTGGVQTFTVPAGDTTIHVLARGAPGGSSYGLSGGIGAQVTSDLTVTPGEVFYVEVGGKGGDAQSAFDTGAAGGFNGGGAGGNDSGGYGDGGGGGGGASDIRTSSSDLSSRLVVAGGGGGNAADCTGGAWGYGGYSGADAYDTNGANGPNCGSGAFGYGGAGATTSAGGAGGGGYYGGTGGAGVLGVGGRGQNGSGANSPGGGGGGGYYGGGGGGEGGGYSAGGGGAGSNYSSGTNTTIVSGFNDGYNRTPEIDITYTLAQQTVSFPSTTVTYGEADFGPASASSGLPVSYSDPSGQCSVDAQGLVQIKGAGSCTVTANQAGDSTWAAAAPVTQTFTIDKASQSVSVSSTPPASAVYGGSYTVVATGGASGNPVMVSVDPLSTVGGCSVSGFTVSFTGVGTCMIDVAQAGNNDYQAAQTVTQSVTVAPAEVHVDANPASDTYGQSDPNPSATLRASDLQNSDTASTIGLIGSPSCQIASHSQDAGSYSDAITCHPGSLSASNYTFVSGNAAYLTINQSVVHVDANTASGVYGQPDPNPSATLRASDFQYSDTASGASGEASCQIASNSQDAGSYSGAITCDPGSLSDSNYTFVSGNAADLTIDPAVVHVDANAAPTTYGQPDPSPSARLRASDFQYADTASAASGSANCQIASHSQDAGSYSDAITCQPGSLTASNYTFVSGNAADLTINRAVVRVDAKSASDTYGQPDPAASATLRASDFQYSDTASVASGSASCQIASHSQDAGSYSGAITCGAGSLSSANYMFVAGVPADLTINKAVMHVDGDAASETYGQSDPSPSATLRASGFQYSDTASVATGAASCQIASHSQDAGIYSDAITCQPGSLSASNYTFVAGTGADLTIDPAVVHVDANSASKTYGGADPVASATLRASDFQHSDTASVASGSANCQIASHSQNAGTDRGTIACQTGSLSAPNYTFVAGNPADLTINQAVVHVDANPASEIYGQTDPSPSATLRASDFQYSDTAGTSGVTDHASCSLASHSQNTGTYAGAITCQPGGLSAPNYTFLPGSAADLRINPAVVHVDANSASKMYGDADPAASATLRASDFQYSDTASVPSGSASCQIASHSQDASSYSGAVTCRPGSLNASNYTFVAGSPADLTINQAPLTVTADNQTKLFGAPTPALTATISGFVLGQSLANSGVSGSPACVTTAVATSPGGTYPIRCVLGSLTATNYTFAGFAAGTLTIKFSQTVPGTVSGKLTVAAGQAVLLSAGSSVSGSLTIDSGGSLESDGATISGPLKATGAAAIRVCKSTITGPMTITGSTGPVIVGDDDGPVSCSPTKISGPARITGNTAAVEFDGNTVTGPLTITGNTGTLLPPDTGTVDAAGNTVSGPQTIQN